MTSCIGARELVMDEVSAARSACLMVGRGPSRGRSSCHGWVLPNSRPCPSPARGEHRDPQRDGSDDLADGVSELQVAVGPGGGHFPQFAVVFLTVTGLA